MLKNVVQQGHKRVETGSVAFSPSHPELSEQLFSRVGYVEDFGELRTTLVHFFSIRVEGLTLAGGPNARRPQAAVDVHRAACDRRELNTYGSSSDVTS